MEFSSDGGTDLGELEKYQLLFAPHARNIVCFVKEQTIAVDSFSYFRKRLRASDSDEHWW